MNSRYTCLLLVVVFLLGGLFGCVLSAWVI
jgi:hypothetical protein